jgi:Na+-driven multidrug efflux pump
MRASGNVLVPTAISMFAIAGVEVPVAWFLSKTYGLDGIWAAYPVAFLVMLGLQTAYYRGVWRHQPIRRL